MASASSSAVLGGLKCGHNIPAVLKTCKRGDNRGRQFYSCPIWPPCNFFEWYTGNQLGCVDGEVMSEKETHIVELVAEKRKLEEKVEKLKKKKTEMGISLNEMKSEAWKHKIGKNKLFWALVGSWVMFVATMYFI